MVISLAAAVFLFTKNQSLEKSFTQLKEEQDGLEKNIADAKTKAIELEKDLIFYKGPGMKKEAEVLRFKLAEREKALASSKKESDDLRKQIASQEAKFPKATVYLDVIDEVQKVYLDADQWKHDETGLNRIEAKISAFNNAGLSAKWKIVRDTTNGGWTAEYIGGMLAPIISNLRDALR